MAEDKNHNTGSTGDENKEQSAQPGIPEGPQIPSSMDDSASDEERLKQETSYIEIPDVSDIPGQENIEAPPIGELGDQTISSDDEEGFQDGKDLLREAENEEDMEIIMGTDADVTKEDLQLLGRKDGDMDGGDDDRMQMEGLDDTDFEGELLNEGVANTDSTGDELDIPEADFNDPKQDSMGQGDEENNYFSLGSSDNDNITEGTP